MQGPDPKAKESKMTVHRTNRGTFFLAAALVALAWAWVHLPQTATAAGCGNEAIRTEQGAALALPDCRAYELVSPGSSPLVDSAGMVNFGVRAANDGNAMAYLSYYPFEGSPSSGWFFRARRGTAGWSLEEMSPQVLPGAAPKVVCEAIELNYSENLLASVLRIGREIKEEYPGASFCSQPQAEIVPGEPRGFANLLRRAAPGSPYELVNQTPADVAPANAQFQDASDDLSHIVFGEEAQLTPEAPPGYDLYVWTGGTVRLVTFLPNGTPARGDLAGATEHLTAGVEAGGTFNGTAPITNGVSADGERIFFYANGNLYLRENAAQPPAATPACGASKSAFACTRQIDRSLGEGSPGGGVFQYASADGSRVFFTDESKLTSPSSAAAGKPALYEYNVESHALADRTPGVAGADVRGFSGAARDGSRLYFVAKAALTGAQQNGQAEVAQAGKPNLYLLENGALTFIATLDPTTDRSAWSFELTPKEGKAPTGGAATLATRTSPGGRYFAFNSARGLTGNPGGTTQIFVYDAVNGSMSCASCLPGGSAPPGPSQIPSPIATTEVRAPAYLPRGLTDNGQLFFTTPQALLHADTDGVADVYEYRQGELHLISDDGGSGPSYFFDASLGAGDVFFATSDALVRSDTDNALNLYDARADGGFAEPPAPAPACATGEPCRDAGSGALATGTLATQFQAGAGNVLPAKRCKRGKVRRKGHCVKKGEHRRHKKHQRNKHRTSKRGTR
jgi:hypothetical protein